MSNLSGFVKRIRDIMRNDAGINGDAQRIEQIAWMLFLKVYDAKEKDWEWDDEEYVSIIPEECRWQTWAVDDHTGSALTGDKALLLPHSQTVMEKHWEICLYQFLHRMSKFALLKNSMQLWLM